MQNKYEKYKFLLTTASGVESICKKELEIYGIYDVKCHNGFCIVDSDISFFYYSQYIKTANRIYIILEQMQITSYDDFSIQAANLFDKMAGFEREWQKKIECRDKIEYKDSIHCKYEYEKKFKLDIACKKSEFKSEKTIYAIFLKEYQRKNLTASLNSGVFIDDDISFAGIDIFGYSLHIRGYRKFTGVSPIKETLASAMVIHSISKDFDFIIDPFCGSGTIVLEAFLFVIGTKISKLNMDFCNNYFTYNNEHDDEVASSINSRLKKFEKLRVFICSDIDKEMFENSQANFKRLVNKFGLKISFEKQFTDFVIFKVKNLDKEYLFLFSHCDAYDIYYFLTKNSLLKNFINIEKKQGLVISNLPYGKRLKDDIKQNKSLAALQKVDKDFYLCKRCYLTNMKWLNEYLKNDNFKKRKLYNGKIEVTFFQYNQINF
jgi:putative N6-adenine-specific DNA methylase